jgi:hypothetical protein
MKDEKNEEVFCLRSYAKVELAMLYAPGLCATRPCNDCTGGYAKTGNSRENCNALGMTNTGMCFSKGRWNS